MVTKYNVGESNQLVSGLHANLSNSRDVYTNLSQAMGNFFAALLGNQFQGATYDSANRYFSQVLNPLVTKGKAIVSDGEKDLKTFEREAGKINHYGDLDKTKLEADKQAKEAVKRSAEASLEELKRWETLKTVNPFLYNQLRLIFEGSKKQMILDIKKINEKIKALDKFETNTNALFVDSFTALEAFQKAVVELKNVKISATGQVTIPDNIFKLISDMNAVKLTAGDADSEKNSEVKVNDKKQVNETIKFINDLYKKNPAEAIKRIENDERLFGYIIGGLDKCPKELQDVILGLFIARENWDELPKKYVTKLVNNPKFAYYVNKLPINSQGKVYAILEKLSKKGWDVLAPLGYVTSALSKSSVGAKIIDASKSGLKIFKKLDKVKAFIKENEAFGKVLGYTADGLSFLDYAYSEYSNPNSPAYGDISKAIYGGINLFFWNVGPIEGAQYGGPVGALSGTVNTVVKGVDITTPSMSIDTPFGTINIDSKNFYLGLSGSAEQREENKRKWLDEQYGQYGKHDSVTTDKNYRPGVQPESGTPNFNPGTEYKPNINGGGVNPNQSPYSNWGAK